MLEEVGQRPHAVIRPGEEEGVIPAVLGLGGLYRVPALYEVPGRVARRLALRHDGDVVPRHPRRRSPVHSVRLGLVRTMHVLHDEVDVILACNNKVVFIWVKIRRNLSAKAGVLNRKWSGILQNENAVVHVRRTV